MIPRLDELYPQTHATRHYLKALRAAGFQGDIGDDMATRVVGATDNSVYQILPQAIIYPKGRGDVVMAVKAAQAWPEITLTARGGGTGTNGQSLTAGIILDLGRHMNHILSVGPAEAEVEAGVVRDQLNAAVVADGLFLAASLSPSSRATIGGMIATDASGQGSRTYGKTSEHVNAVEVVLADASVLLTRPLSRAEIEAMPAWGSDAPLAERLPGGVLALIEGIHDEVLAAFPKIRRFLTGYNLAHVWDPASESLDLKWLFTGAEGSLGFVTRAWMKLSPIPRWNRLFVLEFDSFESALASAESVLAHAPTAIETVDELILEGARKDIIWQDIAAYFPDRGPAAPETRSVNLVEFSAETEAALEAKIAPFLKALEGDPRPGWPIGWSVAADEAARSALWDLRAKGVGLLGNLGGSRKPVAFVEDTVVPPAHLAEYIREFRKILDAEGLRYAMYGHVDVGCIHVRPALDTRDPDDEARLVRISDRVAALCERFGGVIWGEHGKGFRSEYSPLHFGALYPYMEQVKDLFDPKGIFNPGKVATPSGRRDELAKVASPTRGSFDRQIPQVAQDTFAKALDCNGNGLCYHWSADHVMCPSHKATRDIVHTPKGRAGLMREWLRQLGDEQATQASLEGPPWWRSVLESPVRAWNSIGKLWGRYDYSHEVNDAMQGCLACKACASQCPVQVDVPTWRASFLESYHGRYLRPPRDHLVGRLEGSLAWMAKAPRFFNIFLKNKLFQKVFGSVVGLVDTPPLATTSVKASLKAKGFGLLAGAELGGPKVVLLQDAFTSFYEPHIVAETFEFLTKMGLQVELAPFIQNGKGLHVKGFLRRFKRRAQKSAMRLKALAEGGAILVAIDPAVALTYRDEYKHALGQELGFEVRMLQELLLDFMPNKPLERIQVGPVYQLYAHCTEKTLAPASERQWVELFRRAGARLEIERVGCCGMCGAFGHEKIHQEETRGIWERSWAQHLPEGKARARVVATGYSCRSQTERFAGFVPQHPVEVLNTLWSANTSR